MDAEIQEVMNLVVGAVLICWLVAIEVEHRYRYRRFRKKNNEHHNRLP